jgi:rod shape-determining protein MreC
VHDPKAVRRRRAVLAALVIGSLILLTASFDGGGGGVNAVQRGVGDVIAPIQEGASRALKPFRDLFGWVGDTVEAKQQNAQLRKERDRLREQVAGELAAVRQNAQLKGLLDLERNVFVSDYDPVTARVIGQSPTLWFSTMKIDKGTSDGVREEMPVVASDGEGSGLIGTVTSVTGGNAIVTLISDTSSRVSARIGRLSSKSSNGFTKPEVGNPRDLVLEGTRRTDDIRRGDLVVTTGTRDPEFPSLFPSDIPIGRVTRIDDPGTDNQEVHLRPDVDLRRVEFVRVLTANLGRVED